MPFALSGSGIIDVVDVALAWRVVLPSDVEDDPESALEAIDPELHGVLVAMAREGELGEDLLLLPDQAQRLIGDAALARALTDRGHAVEVVGEELANASAAEVSLAEQVLMSGLIDAIDVSDLMEGLRRPRSIDADDSAAPATGGASNTWVEGSTDASKTMASGAGDAVSLDLTGFPGEDGRFGEFDLLARVAEGGMGVVFKARERRLNRIVALKVMRGGALASKIRRRRFVAEAEAAAALSHPHIVQIHQIGEQGGYPFYTMDFVSGLPLTEFAQERGSDLTEIATLMRKVADAVHHFHQRGIIHRDLKPDNILATDEGEPRVIDFGIAKRISSDLDTTASWTVEGEILGTPYYMPPEQATGRVNDIDIRSDVYALGAILYQLLSRRPPFHGMRAAQVILAIQNEDPSPIRFEGPRDTDLEAIVEVAMAKDRGDRYQSALDLAQDLQRYLDHEPIEARPNPFPVRVKKLLRRHRGRFLAAAGVLLALTALGVSRWLDERARAAELAMMMTAARDAPLKQQPSLYAKVLGLEPSYTQAGLEKAQAEMKLAALLEQRERAEALRFVEARRRSELAEAALRNERANQRARLLEEAERARTVAEKRAQAQAERRAQKLLVAAQGARDPLDAVDLLTEALALVSESTEVGRRIATRKAKLALQLATDALDQHRPGLAGYWLKQAERLEAARRSQAVGAVRARLKRLERGQPLYESGRALLAKGRWRAARQKLRDAQARGWSSPDLLRDLQRAQAGCEAEGAAALAEGRRLMKAGRLSEAIDRGRQALQLLEAQRREAAQAHVERGALRLLRVTQERTCALWRVGHQRRAALATLERLEVALRGTPALAWARQERRQRARLLDEPALRGLVYVPPLTQLGGRHLFIQEHEVSNAAFKAFVRAKGYRTRALWDEAGWRLRARFRDGTPGRPQPGPRVWRQGGYGEAGNAARPVRGVSWYEARAYARWLSIQTGMRWRLPTAREWEAAAGWDPGTDTVRAYPWGDDYAAGSLRSGGRAPSLSGGAQRDRSPLGLLDAGGNVCEWVTSANKPALKGASFAHDLLGSRHFARVRTTGRPGANPDVALLRTVGFRLALEPDPKGTK